MYRFAVLFFLSLMLSFGAMAQGGIPSTSTTDLNAKMNKEKERPKSKRYMTIIKFNTKKTLYGNKCFEDFTRQLGFVYDIQVKGQSGSNNGFTKFWHNSVVKSGLFFTAWPWWKLRVNKRFKKCQKSSGDFVG